MLAVLVAILGAALLVSPVPTTALAALEALEAPDDVGPGGPGGLRGSHWGWTGTGACPYYCACYQDHGQRRVDCVSRRLVSINLGLPADTEVADLSDNVISVLDDGCFQKQGLVQLRQLNLSQNGIRDVYPQAFAGLRLLIYLDLSYNNLQSLPLDTFARNRGLKTLLLAGNNLAHIPADGPVLAAPRLQVLDVSNCKLAHVSTSLFSELPALASLNLSANYLIQLRPQAVARQRQLQVLDLTRNPLACDVNTRQGLLQLHDLNVTVRHSCPTPAAAGSQRLDSPPAAAGISRWVARLMNDVDPSSEPDGHVLDVPDAAGAPGEGHRDASGPRQTYESIVIGTPVEVEPDEFDDYVEERFMEPVNEGAGKPPGTWNPGQGPGAPTNKRDAFGRDCPPLFPERNTKNPIMFKDWFDPIPSFWAAVFGGWVGLVLGLVLSSCACHQSFWRAMCLGSTVAPGDRSRNGRNRIRRHSRNSRARISMGIAYAEAEAESRGLILWPEAPSSSACGSAQVLVGNAMGDARPRPETPPPAYNELERTGF